MLDTITAASDRAATAVRSLADRDEYGPLRSAASGLFTAPLAPVALLTERDDLGRRLDAWVPDGHVL